jgi:hypothetical protein
MFKYGVIAVGTGLVCAIAWALAGPGGAGTAALVCVIAVALLDLYNGEMRAGAARTVMGKRLKGPPEET